MARLGWTREPECHGQGILNRKTRGPKETGRLRNKTGDRAGRERRKRKDLPTPAVPPFGRPLLSLSNNTGRASAFRRRFRGHFRAQSEREDGTQLVAHAVHGLHFPARCANLTLRVSDVQRLTTLSCFGSASGGSRASTLVPHPSSLVPRSLGSPSTRRQQTPASKCLASRPSTLFGAWAIDPFTKFIWRPCLRSPV